MASPPAADAHAEAASNHAADSTVLRNPPAPAIAAEGTGGGPATGGHLPWARVSDVVVMTFNIRTDRGLDGRNSWWLRRGATVAAVRAVAPDVAALQEVRRFQLGHLKSALPEYGFLSVGRANGRKRGEHCPILFRHDRFQVAQWDVRWFSEDRSGRIATVARLSDRADGRTFSVVSTHLDHRSAEARVSSAAALALWVRTWTGPWIVMGDFNATAVDPSVGSLLATGLRDALEHLPSRGTGAATAHAFSGRQDGDRIDHVLVSTGWQVVEARIVHDTPDGRLPSDHWPVMARLQKED